MPLFYKETTETQRGGLPQCHLATYSRCRTWDCVSVTPLSLPAGEVGGATCSTPISGNRREWPLLQPSHLPQVFLRASPGRMHRPPLCAAPTAESAQEATQALTKAAEILRGLCAPLGRPAGGGSAEEGGGEKQSLPPWRQFVLSTAIENRRLYAPSSERKGGRCLAWRQKSYLWSSVAGGRRKVHVPGSPGSVHQPGFRGDPFLLHSGLHYSPAGGSATLSLSFPLYEINMAIAPSLQDVLDSE